MLVSRVLRYKHVTDFNITPAHHMLPILEVQGYVRYHAGRLVCVPALSARSFGSCVEAVTPGIRRDEDLASFEIELLLAHAKYGCMSLIRSAANRRHPFIFMFMPSPEIRLGFRLPRLLSWFGGLHSVRGAVGAVSGSAMVPCGRARLDTGLSVGLVGKYLDNDNQSVAII